MLEFVFGMMMIFGVWLMITIWERITNWLNGVEDRWVEKQRKKHQERNR